ncbi:MAG: pantoate--beta-alanine ligase, partial [Dehalococcoidia bacterium]|nr:pantoate--beta-alanine ligase [Dehalococcoidia bacterium]
MEILRTPAALRAWRTGLEGQVGLVPTMGYLHDGHMSLVARCVEENNV